MLIQQRVSDMELNVTRQEQAELERLILEHDRIAQRFTRPRQMIYLFVRRAGNQGVGAYVLLEALKTYSPNARPATVYRALDYLLRLGLVVKIDSQSKFFARSPHSSQRLCLFMVCSGCGSVHEFIDPFCEKKIEDSVLGAGSVIDKKAVEISVLCEMCHPVAGQRTP